MIEFQQRRIRIGPVVHRDCLRVRRDREHADRFQHPLLLELVPHRVREIEKHTRPRAAEQRPDHINRDAFAHLQAVPNGRLFRRVLRDLQHLLFEPPRNLVVVPEVRQPPSRPDCARALVNVAGQNTRVQPVPQVRMLPQVLSERIHPMHRRMDLVGVV